MVNFEILIERPTVEGVSEFASPEDIERIRKRTNNILVEACIKKILRSHKRRVKKKMKHKRNIAKASRQRNRI